MNKYLTIVLKPRIKPRDTKRFQVKWYSPTLGYDLEISEIIEEIKAGNRFKFDMSYNGKYKDNFDKFNILFKLKCDIDRITEKQNIKYELNEYFRLFYIEIKKEMN